jgi:hypothetical protein
MISQFLALRRHTSVLSYDFNGFFSTILKGLLQETLLVFHDVFIPIRTAVRAAFDIVKRKLYTVCLILRN